MVPLRPDVLVSVTFLTSSALHVVSPFVYVLLGTDFSRSNDFESCLPHMRSTAGSTRLSVLFFSSLRFCFTYLVAVAFNMFPHMGWYTSPQVGCVFPSDVDYVSFA